MTPTPTPSIKIYNRTELIKRCRFVTCQRKHFLLELFQVRFKPERFGATSEISHFGLVLGPWWIVPVSRTGIRWEEAITPPPFARWTSVRYPVPGIAIELVKTGPKWPRESV